MAVQWNPNTIRIGPTEMKWNGACCNLREGEVLPYSIQIAEVEELFFFQIVGGTAHRRMKVLHMLRRIQAPKHRRVISQRGRLRKESRLRSQRSETNFDELQW